MPPNLGGFFMVRSYYPSECHADYFDFERIEALKPAIEACGISTLSQSPMLGFHKQMDNRIKLLEDMLSRRIQFVEFDNGDFFFQAENAIRDVGVTGVQTCALPISDLAGLAVGDVVAVGIDHSCRCGWSIPTATTSRTARPARSWAAGPQ